MKHRVPPQGRAEARQGRMSVAVPVGESCSAHSWQPVALRACETGLDPKPCPRTSPGRHHCASQVRERFVWGPSVELSHPWRPWEASAPGTRHGEQCRGRSLLRTRALSLASVTPRVGVTRRCFSSCLSEAVLSLLLHLGREHMADTPVAVQCPQLAFLQS